jgi:predicted ArsR family transcriptional regulator
VRIGLLEALAEHGPLTATQAAEHVGESPSSCSWHLRQLAKFGFVEEAGGEAAGRRRPWRLTAYGLSFTVDGTQDPETLAAGRALERLFADRYLDRAERGLRARPDLPAQWQRATGTSQFILHVTAEELEALHEEVIAVLTRFHERVGDPANRPAGARTIEALLLAYPRDDA